MNYQKNIEASIKGFEVRVGQIAKQHAKNHTSAFNSNTKDNPKEWHKEIRSSNQQWHIEIRSSMYYRMGKFFHDKNTQDIITCTCITS